MKKKVINKQSMQGANVLVLSSEGNKIDFYKELVLIRIYFDGETVPSIATDATHIAIENNQRSGVSVELPILGDKMVIELSANSDEVLNDIEIEQHNRESLTFNDKAILTLLIQAFKESVGIMNMWNATFDNRVNVMVAINQRSQEHHRVLNEWLNFYETHSMIKADLKMKKQHPKEWMVQESYAQQNLDDNTIQLHQFCKQNQINLKNIFQIQ